MKFSSETTADDVSERPFTLDDISGVLWSPADDAERRPLVLLAHGGGQHKRAPGVVARARHFVSRCGFGAAAIDAPGHGDRPRTDRDQAFAADLRARMTAGEPVGAEIARYNAELAARAVPEWRATLDALVGVDEVGTGPVGFWGVSLGSAIGLPLVAADGRITAAVLGLVGYADVAEVAPRVTVPVRLLVQWDDELVSRESAFALYSALGSADKTAYVNPGRHVAVPRFEVEDSGRFLARHLGPGGGG